MSASVDEALIKLLVWDQKASRLNEMCGQQNSQCKDSEEEGSPAKKCYQRPFFATNNHKQSQSIFISIKKPKAN